MPRARTRPPTIIDVAKAAGVSKSAVSRALLGQGEVSDSVRRRVIDAADQLGYVANAMARGLVSERTRTLGVVLHDVTDPFAGYLHVAMQTRAAELGYSVVTATNPGDLTFDNALTALRTLISLQVDGLLVCSARFPSERVLPFVDRLPVVAAGRRETALSSVCVDDRDGGEQLAGRLLELGHRTVAVILVDGAYSYSQHLRGVAMIARLRGGGASVIVREVATNADVAGVLPGLVDLPELTAVMCPNDRTQVAVMEYCRAAGVDVPGRLSVTGFDGIGPLTTSLLELTTFRQPIERIGRASVDLMIDAIDHGAGEPGQILMRGELVAGATVAAVS